MKTLEGNRKYFGKEPEIEDPDNPGEMIECDPKKARTMPIFRWLQDSQRICTL
jgi:hypothetical protein